MDAGAIPESLEECRSAWNERDPERIRGHLDTSVVDDVLFVDPAHTTRNVDELEEMVREARGNLPEADYVLASGIDGHNNRYRYRWEVQRPGAREALLAERCRANLRLGH